MDNLTPNLAEYSAIIITGGSSGIGECFINTIVNLHPNVLICNLSRSKPSSEFSGLRHFECDLTQRHEVAEVVDQALDAISTKAPSGKVLLINNSGIGAYGPFPEPDVAFITQLLDLNITSVLQLTGFLLPEIKKRGGGIINVGSVAGFQPLPFRATYSASKAFILSWSLALQEELRPHGVHVLTLCPGRTRTQFFKNAGAMRKKSLDVRFMEPEVVVAAAFKAFFQKKNYVIPGFRNQLLIALTSHIPKAWVARIVSVFI